MREWRMGKPSEAGVEAGAILRLLNSWEEARLGVHSVMILRYNICIAQGWWKPYRPEENHVMFSLSKSFTSTAIGFAVQEGLLSLEDTVLSFSRMSCHTPPVRPWGI
ncbi:MAG: serine hydrolase [Clostridia bacterium]